MTEKIIVEVDRELEDLMPLFTQTRERDMDGLAAGLAANDCAALRMIGHGMKGSGGAFGFPLITEMGDAIEAAALKGDTTAVKQQLEMLRSYMARIDVKYI